MSCPTKQPEKQRRRFLLLPPKQHFSLLRVSVYEKEQPTTAISQTVSTMATINTAPIKYAQRKDSLYLTINLPGKPMLSLISVISMDYHYHQDDENVENPPCCFPALLFFHYRLPKEDISIRVEKQTSRDCLIVVVPTIFPVFLFFGFVRFPPAAAAGGNSLSRCEE